MAERRVAIVTAAGRGMGAACARELAARGYALALMSPSWFDRLTMRGCPERVEGPHSEP